MKANNITALDYSASGERLVLTLSGTSLGEVTGMDTALVTVQTDAGDTVEVFAGYSLKTVTYDLVTSAHVAVLVRGAEDSTGKALDALAGRVAAQEAAQEDIMLGIAELAALLVGAGEGV